MTTIRDIFTHPQDQTKDMDPFLPSPSSPGLCGAFQVLLMIRADGGLCTASELDANLHALPCTNMES